MYQKEFDAAFYIIKLAAEEISCGYFNGSEVSTKGDGSVVTETDKKVDQLIREYLKEKFPEYGLLTEESKDDLSRIDKEFVWIIDPIDGTLEFVNHQYEFVTNIALARNHEIVLALISAPLTKEVYYAIKGEGAYLFKDGITTKIRVSDKTSELTCLTSPFHMTDVEKDYIKKHKSHIKEVKYGGAAYKACLIASGKADVSYRLSPNSKEWDTAAPDLLVREAGGVFYDKNRKPFSYNKVDVRNLDGFIMVNKEENYF